MRKILIIGLLLAVNACAIHKTDFKCKTNDGLGCTSMSHINQMINEKDDLKKLNNNVSANPKPKLWYHPLNEQGEPTLELKSIEFDGAK